MIDSTTTPWMELLAFSHSLSGGVEETIPSGHDDVDEEGNALPPDTPTGFAVEMIARTCDLCGLRCDFVLGDTQECWTSAGFPGQGLQAGWFDACNSFTSTARRKLGVDFSDAIGKPRPAGILTRLDAKGNPVIPASSDLSDVVVAIVAGWATTDRSIGYATNRCTGEKFNASPLDGYITYTPNDRYGGPDAAMAALLSGAADAVYMYTGMIEDRRGCTQEGCNASLYDGLGTEYAWIHKDMLDYQVNGTTLAMTKKGSKLNQAIDPCIRTVMRSEFYAKLCAKYERLGFKDVGCYENDYFEAFDEEDEEDEEEDFAAPTPAPSGSPSEQQASIRRGDCSTGYCGCTAS